MILLDGALIHKAETKSVHIAVISFIEHHRQVFHYAHQIFQSNLVAGGHVTFLLSGSDYILVLRMSQGGGCLAFVSNNGKLQVAP